MSTTTTSSMEILRVDPLAYGPAIKALFAANDRAEFAGYFDRAFPDAVRDGGCSWVGLGGDGAVVVHVGLFTHRFQIGRQSAVGGLLVNLLSSRAHRSFFPALALVRRAVADARATGTIDFLYTDPNEQARRLIELAGLAPVGELDRFVLPLRGRGVPADGIVRLYHLACRARSWRGDTRAGCVEAAAFDVAAIERPPASEHAVRPFRPASLFRRRLAGYPGRQDAWFSVATTEGGAAAAVRSMPDGTALLCAVRRDEDVPLAAVLPAIVPPLRSAGNRTLWLFTLAGTRFAGELTRIGFVPRHERVPVLGVSLTALGKRVLEAIHRWEATHLDFDR